jgi:hypothetical protein
MSKILEVLGAGAAGAIISLLTVLAVEYLRIVRSVTLRQKFDSLRRRLGFRRALETFINLSV